MNRPDSSFGEFQTTLRVNGGRLVIGVGETPAESRRNAFSLIEERNPDLGGFCAVAQHIGSMKTEPTRSYSNVINAAGRFYVNSLLQGNDMKYKKNYSVDGWPVEDVEQGAVLDKDEICRRLNSYAIHCTDDTSGETGCFVIDRESYTQTGKLRAHPDHPTVHGSLVELFIWWDRAADTEAEARS